MKSNLQYLLLGDGVFAFFVKKLFKLPLNCRNRNLYISVFNHFLFYLIFISFFDRLSIGDNMEKIKVIFTGGTIGSLANGNDISPDGKTKYLLLEKYGRDIERFVTSSPLFILSENANLGNVLKMAQEINVAQNENVKGIILTHGTDTLAYTAPLLSFLIQNPKVPIVLVSSDYVLNDERANGIPNFTAAVELIDNAQTKPAIYVAYKNQEDDFTSIFLGVRICEPAPYSSCFGCPLGQRFAICKNNKIEYENTRIIKDDKLFNLTNDISKIGLFINPYLGLDYSVYKNVRCDFILHNLYHSGTANTQNFENYETNFLNFADHCNKNNTPLYLCNIKKQDINYNSTNQMLQKNVKFLYNTLPNVALAKLYVAYNFVAPNELDLFLNSSIAGEILE